MRGLAAIGVLLFHLGFMGATKRVPGGYLAVDFFFVLSGFVISRVYEARMRAGLSVIGFMQIRIARLYPLYLLAFCIGLAELVSRSAVSPALVGGAALNALMLPGLPGEGFVVEANNPAWSLSLEMLVNLLYALALPLLTSRRLGLLVAASGGVLIYGIAQGGTVDQGVLWSNAALGVPRILWSFGMGVLIGRAARSVERHSDGLALVALALLVAALVVPVRSALGWTGDALIVLFGFPLLVWWCAGFDCGPAPSRALTALGSISYPVYILHFPLLLVALEIGHRFGLPPKSVRYAGIAGVIIAATLAARYVEGPARRWMMARWSGSRPSG